MRKIELEDLKVLEGYLKSALNEIDHRCEWAHTEETDFIQDALAEIERWKEEENGKRN